MIKLRNGVLLALGWATSACGQSSDARGSRGGAAVDLAANADLAPLQGDATARQADSLVRIGRAWRATALLAPRLTTPATAPPELRLAAARAAAEWDGWTEVDRLLRDAPWLDSAFGGEGRELLVRSQLERGQESVPDATLALAAAHTASARVTRSVLLARANDRANFRDSAAAGYLAAAAQLPRVRDWLRLRAAGLIADSAKRAGLFKQLTDNAAKARVPFTDAQARERSGDLTGAARVYASAGAHGAAFRALALDTRDSAAKQTLAARIVAYLTGNPAPAEARQAIEVLDGMKLTLAPAQELVVARAAAEQGSAARAVSGFAHGGALSPRDRMAFAGALLRAGRAADAARQYATLVSDPSLSASAGYQRARALLQAGDGAGSRAALRALTTANGASAAPALLLLADLQIDDGDVAGAAQSLAQLTSRYPTASQAPLARFRAGLIAWSSDARRAAAQWDSLVTRYPGDQEATAARYWAARAYEKLGQRGEAERRWREIITSSPLSYYAAASAARLGSAGWTPPPGPDSVAHLAGVDSAVARIATLDRLGMDVESRFELDALGDRAERVPAEAAAIAQALIAAGQPSRALRVAAKALDAGTPTRALLRAAYPVVHEDALADESKRNGLDPALVAGLIRQESSWNPRAVSPVGARGLMQLMPTVGASIAAGRHYPIWNPALLFEPDVSLELGTAHLATSLRRGSPVAPALAAYNAGASRVLRWSQRPGASDPELFTEWIPYTETRDYVRIVQRNARVYKALYGI